MAALTHAFLVSGQTDPRVRTLGEFVYRSTSLDPTFVFESLDHEPLIQRYALSEQPGCVVIALLTGDDVGRTASQPAAALAPRPSQGVVLALGYFLARLPADHIIVLREDGLVGPEDMDDVTYLSLDDADWQHKLGTSLENLGVTVDFTEI